MPIAVVAAAKTIVWAKMPGIRNARVVAAARDVDRAAEHEREQQHEHDRLEDREDRELRDPRDALEVPPADEQAVGDRPADAAARGGPSSGGHAALLALASVVGVSSSAGVAGEGQEDIVERGPAQADVVDVRSPPRRSRARPGRAPRRRRWSATVRRRVCSSTVTSPWQSRDRISVARLDLVAVADDDLDALAADLRLELVGRPAGDDLAVVDDGDRVGELVGLLEVLGRQEERHALAHEPADDLPHADPAARVEAGRRLVEEQQPRPPDERARQVQPAAHAARVGLDDAIGGVDEVELLEQLVARRCASADDSW